MRTRGLAVLTAVVAAVLASLVAVPPTRAAEDAFAWAPAHAPAVAQGRQSGERFGLVGLTEVEVEVEDLYDAANREALAVAEQKIAGLVGVRAVFGPAGLLDVTVDPSGKPSARPVLARGPSEIHTGALSEAAGEAARQRIVRRADALGWFTTENGRRVRFLVDAPNWQKVEPAVAKALADSGLEILAPPGGGLDTRALWPDPRSHRARFLPLAFAVIWALFVMVGAARAHFPLGRRRLSRAVAAGVAAAAPFALMTVPGVRLAGALAALGAAAVALAGARPRDLQTGGPPRFWRPVLWISAALALEVFALSPRLKIGTRQWSAAPMFFVSVHGDLDEPVVLREVRRFADDLRAQPGVANAWSIADLFLGVTFQGKEASGIPDDPEELRRILVQARTDPAVRLELSADRREALIGVRFDDDPTVDHLAIVRHAQRYIERELRRALTRVDLASPGASPVARLVGAGILAGDARERVLRICARSGRTLNRAEALSVERAARAAALIPAADVPRLDAEVSDTVRSFAAHHPWSLNAAATERLVLGATALATDATADDVRAVVVSAYGARLPSPMLTPTATALARRIAGVQRRHTARLDFKEMLYGADLPTEGVLADEVRSTTLEAMGPVVGIPVAPDVADAFRLDARPIGGAPNDLALSEIWNRALRAGLVAAAGTIAILLVLVGGPGAITSLPLAFAPLAAAIAPSAILREPVGLPMISFFAGALAGGALLALIATPSREERRRRR
ncbi:MAG TPA: hypothetical protein VGP64_08185 [Polyangia bacterium]